MCQNRCVAWATDIFYRLLSFMRMFYNPASVCNRLEHPSVLEGDVILSYRTDWHDRGQVTTCTNSRPEVSLGTERRTWECAATRGKNKWVRSTAGIILTGKHDSIRRKTSRSDTLSTTNPTLSGLGMKSGLRDEQPTTNHLRHGAAVSFIKQHQSYKYRNQQC